jgi:hypothetical protein
MNTPSATPTEPASLLGLGPRGEPLDLPDPRHDLPSGVRVRLLLLGYACAYVAALEGRTAAACPHKGCPIWPHRLARWKEAEAGEGTSDQLAAYLDRLAGGPPGRMMVRYDANSGKPARKLPNMGGLGSPLSRVATRVAIGLKKRVTVSLCASCGAPISGRRSKRFCSHRCQLRSHRGPSMRRPAGSGNGGAAGSTGAVGSGSPALPGEGQEQPEETRP